MPKKTIKRFFVRSFNLETRPGGIFTTWMSAMRQLNAACKRAERAERRQQRELEQQQKLHHKMQETNSNAYEAQRSENYISLLQSVHKECDDTYDWAKILNASMPEKPKPISEHEARAQVAFDNYKAGFMDQLLGKADYKKNELLKSLDAAKKQDELEYMKSLEDYGKVCTDLSRIKETAKGILEGDAKSYVDAIKEAQPFGEIIGFGSTFNLNIKPPSQINVTFHVNGERVVPTEIKSFTKSGKLSVKPMPKSKFYEIYQDYICGCVFRVARELFALLPINMVIVTCIGNLLNTQTGHMEEKPILSVALPRATIDKLNFENLDPSDALSNFVHNMDFRKGKGFNAVEAVTLS